MPCFVKPCHLTRFTHLSGTSSRLTVVQDNAGESPLIWYWAAQEGHREIVHALTGAGVAVDLQNIRGNTLEARRDGRQDGVAVVAAAHDGTV